MSNNIYDRLFKLIDAVYAQPHGGAGGKLHIVVDDGNVEAHHIHWCLDQEEITAIERECAEALLELSEEDRFDVYCRYHQIRGAERRALQ